MSECSLPLEALVLRFMREFPACSLKRSSSKQAVAELVFPGGKHPIEITRGKSELSECVHPDDIENWRAFDAARRFVLDDHERVAGFVACLKGYELNNNPHPIDTDEADAWNLGWFSGQKYMESILKSCAG